MVLGVVLGVVLGGEVLLTCEYKWAAPIPMGSLIWGLTEGRDRGHRLGMRVRIIIA
jgi:hypothetical protein